MIEDILKIFKDLDNNKVNLDEEKKEYDDLKDALEFMEEARINYLKYFDIFNNIKANPGALTKEMVEAIGFLDAESKNFLNTASRNIIKYLDVIKHGQDEDEKEIALSSLEGVLNGNKLVKVINNAKIIINDKIDEIEGGIRKYNSRKIELEAILATLNSNIELNNIINSLENTKEDELITCVDEIINYVNSHKDELKDKTDVLFKNIALYNVNVANKIIEQIKIRPSRRVIDSVKHITIDELKKLFEKYEYDYDKLTEEEIKNITENGVYDDVDYVLNFFHETKFNFFKKEKREALTLLYQANKDSIDNVMEVAKEASEELGQSLNNFVNNTLLSKFLPAFRYSIKTETRERTPRVYTPGTQRPNDNDTVDRANKKFVENLIFLKSLGYGANEIFANNLALLTNANTVKRNATNLIDALRAYGISINNEVKLADIIKRLQWAYTYDIASTLDRFAELGQFNYLIKNTSRLGASQSSLILLRIHYCNLHNKTCNHPNGTLVGAISNEKDITTGITRHNKDNPFVTKAIKPEIFDEETENLVIETIENYDGSTSAFDGYASYLLDNFADESKDYLLRFSSGARDVYVSIPKFRRIYSAIESLKLQGIDEDKLLLYALTYNSIISSDEFEIIKSYVNDLGRGTK